VHHTPLFTRDCLAFWPNSLAFRPPSIAYIEVYQGDSNNTRDFPAEEVASVVNKVLSRLDLEGLRQRVQETCNAPTRILPAPEEKNFHYLNHFFGDIIVATCRSKGV
jgi:hypothetical protein